MHNSSKNENSKTWKLSVFKEDRQVKMNLKNSSNEESIKIPSRYLANMFSDIEFPAIDSENE